MLSCQPSPFTCLFSRRSFLKTRHPFPTLDSILYCVLTFLFDFLLVNLQSFWCKHSPINRLNDVISSGTQQIHSIVVVNTVHEVTQCSLLVYIECRLSHMSAGCSDNTP